MTGDSLWVALTAGEGGEVGFVLHAAPTQDDFLRYCRSVVPPGRRVQEVVEGVPGMSLVEQIGFTLFLNNPRCPEA